MVRCVLTDDGAALSRTLPGRGAWLCSRPCWTLARRRRAFARAWHRNVDETTLDALERAFGAEMTGMEDWTASGVAPVQTPTKG